MVDRSFSFRIPSVVTHKNATLIATICTLVLYILHFGMQTTYTKARENLASLLDKVVNDREIIVIERRDKPSVAMIAADELASLKETAYLLRSPKNAARLLSALEWSKSRDEETLEPVPVEEAIASLEQELGIGKEEKS